MKFYSIFNKPRLKIGDIIWAKRYQTLKEKNKIQEGHQEGPFVIIGKTFNKVYALQCTSNKIIDKCKNYYFELNKDKYNLDKNTYAITFHDCIVIKKQFIRKISKLDKKDLNLLYKILYIVSNFSDKLHLKKYKYKNDIGDIIEFNDKLYYILSIDNKYFYVHKINKNPKAKYPIVINDSIYSFNFKYLEKISKKENIKLIDISDLSIVEMVEKRKEEILNPGFKFKRGSLVSSDNKFYYIYGEYKEQWLVYNVYRDSFKGNFEQITINRGRYYTDFKEDTINKNKELKFMRIATNEEIEIIKKSKQSYKTPKTNNIVFHKKIKEGTILLHEKKDEKYIVIRRNNNTIYFVLFDNYKNIIKYELESNIPFSIYGSIDKFELQNIKLKIKN